ncbi:MAG TPA: DegT/DnrJ/EryC1/StrS aminotransferase family protein [Candidatus Acidoferrum sp.]|nr:DegT/DnrJ/EryC1/StrS aminotransferase family protein [Candidatus Acidoferrum sp.]
MRSEFLNFAPPLIGEEEIEEVVKTLREGWITTGPRAQRFETEFSAFVGAPAALAVNSATSAMHIALAALGIGEGDSVVSTTMTFASSIHVIEHQRAHPVLVDVEPDTLNIDPEQVEAAVRRTPGVKAILPVHLYGHPADMDPIYDIARRYGLAVIEDAAHSLPARYHGRMIGAPKEGFDFPNLVAFSFYATKNLTTGEGGMLTGPADLMDDARVWSLHGMSRDAFKRYTSDGSWRYDVVLPGFKYNMPDIQAAIGIHQLKRLEAMQSRRRAIVAQYDEALGQLDELQRPAERPDVESAWHIYLLRLNLERLKIDRAAFIDELRKRNIGTSVHFIPIDQHSFYRDRYGLRPEDFPIAHREFERMLSLPLSPAHTDQDVADVIEAVTDVVRQNRA